MQKISWKRVGKFLGGIFVATWLLGFAMRHGLAWWEARELGHRYPESHLELSPVEDVARVNVTSQISVTLFGWTMLVPNTGLKERHDTKTTAILTFDDGSSIICLGSINGDPVGMYKEQDDIRHIFSKEELESNYTFTMSALRADPDAVSFWHSTLRNAHDMVLLGLKSMYVSGGVGLHPAENRWVRGYEVVMRTKSGKVAYSLSLYDLHDKDMELIVRPATGGQSWINTLLDSIQPTSTSAPDSDAARKVPADA